MTKKNGSRSADLYAELVNEIREAERAVVSAALECIPVNEEVSLHDVKGHMLSTESLVGAVKDLSAINAALKAVERISKKSKSAVAAESV